MKEKESELFCLLGIDLDVGERYDSNGCEDDPSGEEDGVAKAVGAIPDAFQHLVVVHVVSPADQSRQRHADAHKPEDDAEYDVVSQAKDPVVKDSRKTDKFPKTKHSSLFYFNQLQESWHQKAWNLF